MKKNNLSVATIIAAVAAVLLFSGGDAKAQSTSVPLTKKTYFVEVQYHFMHWTSGGESYYWETFFETESYSEAQALYQVMFEAFEDGNLDYLNSYGTTTVNVVVDVRLRTETELLYEIQRNTKLQLYPSRNYQLSTPRKIQKR
jgi:hypothetical protein